MSDNKLEPEFERKIEEAREMLLGVQNNLTGVRSDSVMNEKIENSSPHTLIGVALRSFDTSPNMDEHERGREFKGVLEVLGVVHSDLVEDGQVTAANRVAEAMVLIIEGTSVQCLTFPDEYVKENLPPHYRDKVQN